MWTWPGMNCAIAGVEGEVEIGEVSRCGENIQVPIQMVWLESTEEHFKSHKQFCQYY